MLNGAGQVTVTFSTAFPMANAISVQCTYGSPLIMGSPLYIVFVNNTGFTVSGDANGTILWFAVITNNP
jgi:hypothetical protein